jgi:8-oxo-dGTP pyrophosphatase MutT (NUDIX family)
MPADHPMPFKPEGPPRIIGKAAVRPRNAATLILVRRTAKAPEILMGRRARGHDFMPGKWVFPGGRVDRGDFAAPAADELAPEVEAKLRLTAPRRPTLPRALAMAAVRETWEEVGLMLAKPAPARPAAGPWRGFIEAGALPDLSALHFIARAITPPMIGKRFDARFFMAEASALLSQERTDGSGELDEIAWIPIPEVGDFDLPNVTKFVVKELEARLEDPARPILSLSARGGSRHLARL